MTEHYWISRALEYRASAQRVRRAGPKAYWWATYYYRAGLEALDRAKSARRVEAYRKQAT